MKHRFKDSAGIEWARDSLTGHAVRITPLPSRGFLRRQPATEKWFPPEPPREAPDTAAIVLSFLTSEKPKSPEAAALLLLQSFPTLNAAMLMGALHTYFPKAGALR